MRISETRAVFENELREIVRDRRSLLAGLFYGVWGPLVMGVALMGLARSDADAPVRVALAALSPAPALTAFLDSRNVEIELLPGTPAELIRRRAVPVVLEIGSGYEAAVAESRPADVALYFDGAWSTSARQAARVRTMLSEFGQVVHDARLVGRGVSPQSVRPLTVISRDFSTSAGRAAAVLGTLPIFVLLSVFIGGMSVAADVMAGERERGSLESLLVHAVPRSAIVIGKWAAITAVTVTTLAVTLGVARAVLAHPRVQALDLPIGLSASEALAIAATLLPLAMAVAAIQLLVALRTNSYKEAQTQLTYLMFVPMVPGFVLALGAVETAVWMRVTPIVGQHVFIAELLRGQLPTSGAWVALSVSTLVAGAAALALTTWFLGRESVLRRQSA
jgi:sodium transport system permease protein